MIMFIELNGVYDCDLSKLYFSIKLIAKLPEECIGVDQNTELVFSKTKFADQSENDENDNANNTLDANEALAIFSLSSSDVKDFGKISFELGLISNRIVLRKLKLGHNSCQPGLSFLFSFKDLYGICFKHESFNVINSSCCIRQCVLNINLIVCINSIIESLPELPICDKNVCKVLQGPNIDLLNDWLFCHNHSHESSGQNHSMKSLQIPEEALKPIILDRLEQIVYLLIYNDSDKILLESCHDKNQSIYLELFQKNFYAIHYEDKTKSSGDKDVLEDTDDLSNQIANMKLDESKPSNNNEDIDLRILPKCLVKCKIFSQETLLINGLKDKIYPKSNHQTNQNYFCSNDKKSLTNYRMSFDVEWFRIDDKLFHLLTNHLIKSHLSINQFLQIVINGTVTDLILPSHHFEKEEDELFIATLDLYKFG